MAASNDDLPVRKGFLLWLNNRLPVDAFMRDQLRWVNFVRDLPGVSELTFSHCSPAIVRLT